MAGELLMEVLINEYKNLRPAHIPLKDYGEVVSNSVIKIK